MRTQNSTYRSTTNKEHTLNHITSQTKQRINSNATINKHNTKRIGATHKSTCPTQQTTTNTTINMLELA